MQKQQLRLLRAIVFQQPQRCHQCRHFSSVRTLSQTASSAAAVKASPNLPPVNRPAPDRRLAPDRMRQGFIPKVIGAPIGFEDPPRVGQNWFQLERDGDTYIERNLAKRKILLKQFGKSYVQDFRNLDANRGKLYLANEKLYREDMALYFANLRGRTLSRSAKDTTAVLKGKISVVTVFQRRWAQKQAQTFVDGKQNPELARIIAQSGDQAQVVEINHEDFRLSSLVVRLFEWNLRRTRTAAQQDRYFILPGIPQIAHEHLGMMNDKIGYVFLLDRDCRIRWSACADALPDEKESLVRGVRKLLESSKNR